MVRDTLSQIEWANVEDPVYELITWLDDCSYILQYDVSKMKLGDFQSYINQQRGLMVEVLEIKESCMKYKSTLDTGMGKTVYNFGTICKE